MKINQLITIVVLAALVASPAFSAKKEKVKLLPAGLEKKAERGQSLPPGWLKKLKKGAIMGSNVYQQSKIVVPLDSNGLITISIEGKLVKLYKATREIAEILE